MASSNSTKSGFGRAVAPFWRRAVAFLAVYLYFKYWDYKSRIRHSLHVGSLLVFSISGLLIVFDFAGELLRTSRVRTLFSLLDPFPGVRAFLGLLYVAAASYGVYYHLSEMRKPGHEYTFTQVICDLFESQRTSQTRELFEILGHCHQVFRRSGILHVSISLPQVEGEKVILRTDPKHVYPADVNHESFILPLQVGASVGGRVVDDSCPRYVPRLYFPFGKPRRRLRTWRFPHSVKYKYLVTPEREFRLTEQELDLDCVAGDSFGFSSLLCVPLHVTGEKKARAALNFYFSKVDPLGKPDILMAAALGYSIAQQVPCIQWYAPDT
jgi:hypothetical protein